MDLTYFYGIGEVLAQSLAKKIKNSGYTRNDYTIPELRKILKTIPDLPIITQADVKYHPTRRIHRREIQELQRKLPSTCTIAGSYRRNKPVSSDIDIVFMCGISGIKRAISSIPGYTFIGPFGEGEHKITMFIRKSGSTRTYKADLFACTGSPHFMLLYATGSGVFNLRMRALAKELGYTLNQYGIYKSGVSKLAATSENDIFAFLGLKYITPENRTDYVKLVRI